MKRRSLADSLVVWMLMGGGVLSVAQSSAPSLRAGQWLVHSTVTSPIGRSVSTQQTVCASGISDFWKQNRPGMQCDAPVVSTTSGGVHVHLTCQAGKGPVTWKIVSDVNETIAKTGDSFHATGQTTTTTTIPGRDPVTATATLLSEGSYQGSCATK